VHANTFMTMSPRMYQIGFFLPVVVCLVGPFLLKDAEISPFVMATGVLQVAAVFWLSRKHSASLSQSATQLEQQWRAATDANKAKSQFLAMMSHELRTPLNAVIGYAEMLEENLDEAGRASDASDARRVHRSARTLLGLINEILDLSKIEAGKMDIQTSIADLREIVAEVVQTSAHIAEKNGDELKVELDLDHDVVVTDAVKLRQCLLNLVSNACKFTENGTVTINARLRDGDLRFQVSDTGCGIGQDAGAKLFQPFVQADGSMTRKHGGTGLGLVITQRLAQLLGGDVTMTSVVGQGSVFTFTAKVAAAPRAGHRMSAAA
jgi:signal transduction histidine kinase